MGAMARSERGSGVSHPPFPDEKEVMAQITIKQNSCDTYLVETSLALSTGSVAGALTLQSRRN